MGPIEHFLYNNLHIFFESCGPYGENLKSGCDMFTGRRISSNSDGRLEMIFQCQPDQKFLRVIIQGN